MVVRAGAKFDATDLSLPDVVTAASAGTNVVTATAFANLPTNPCAASIFNPHPGASMLVGVYWGAWMKTSASAVRCCPAISGSKAVAAGVGGDGAIGWGEVPVTSSSAYTKGSGFFTTELPASVNAAVFTMQAYRDSADGGPQNVDYATLRIVPMRYVFE